MVKSSADGDSITKELAEIKSLLQTLVIIEGGCAGLKGDQVRKLAGVKKERVSEIWSDIKNKNEL
jgi:hypothetical protein